MKRGVMVGAITLVLFLIVVSFFVFSGDEETLEEIQKASDEIVIAENKISEVSSEKETAMSLMRLNEAKDLLKESKDAYDNRDYELATELALKSRDYAQESRMEYIGKTAEDLGINIDNEINTEGISLAELESHNEEDNCWVVYEGMVYDVTDYIPRHPGGESSIKKTCGTTNFQTAFVSQHGESKVSKFMEEADVMGTFTN